MEMERFWRWSLVALAAFGVMMVSAGILGTLKLSAEEEAPVSDEELQGTKTDGIARSSQDEIGRGDMHDHSAHGSENGDEANSQELSAVVKVPDTPKMPDSTGSMTGELPLQGERLGTSSSDTASKTRADRSGGEKPKQEQQQPTNGSANRSVATPIPPKAGATSVVVPVRGGNPRPAGVGAGNPVASISMHTVTNDTTLPHSGQSGLGRSWDEEAEADDEDEE